MQIVESSSLVSVLFPEAISHPYISFFHLLVMQSNRQLHSLYTEILRCSMSLVMYIASGIYLADTVINLLTGMSGISRQQ